MAKFDDAAKQAVSGGHALLLGVLCLIFGATATVFVMYWFEVPTISRATAGNSKDRGLVSSDDVARITQQRDSLQADLTRTQAAASSRQLSNTVALATIEAIALGAEDASNKSGFWTEYHLDNAKVSALCWKAAALLRVSEARISTDSGGAEWGSGACILRLVPEGTGAKCGLARFDVIVRYGDMPISSGDDVEAAKKKNPAPGAPVEIVVVRGSRSMKVSVARGHLGVWFELD
jgi:hypothetical protein